MDTPARNNFHIGIVCALDIELTAARAVLDEEYEDITGIDVGDQNTYVLGRINQHKLVIACLPAGEDGTNAAASVVTNMRRTFQSLRFALMVGIGGGIPDPEGIIDVRLGDVVVSQPTGKHSGVVQWDKGKFLADGSFEPKGHLSPPPTILRTALSKLKSNYVLKGSRVPEFLRQVYTKYSALTLSGYIHPGYEYDQLHCSHCAGEGTFCDKCERGITLRIHRPNADPKIHYGTIASGNQVIKNAAERERIRKLCGDAICVEMEAAGLMNNFPSLVIRGICDYADAEKNDKWHGYAALTAATVAKELLLLVPADVASESAQSVSQQELVFSDQETRCHQYFATSTYEEYKNLNPHRSDKTCEWVFQNPVYTEWLESAKDNLLWITTDPGCGKSVLSKSLIDEDLPSSVPHTIICYFFFKDNPEQSRLSTALCALIHQLLKQCPRLVNHALPEWNANRTHLRNDIHALWRIFLNAATEAKSQSVICVLDALDECQEQDQTQLISFLSRFYENAQLRRPVRQNTVKFVVTSRPYDDIQFKFGAIPSGLPEIRLRGEDSSSQIKEEIDMVIKNRVGQLARALPLNDEARSKLQGRLLGMENRTYLWLHLTFESIMQAYAKGFRAEDVSFDTLPASVEDAYEKILRKVDQADTKKIKKLFQIIAGASRPMTVCEMAVALGLALSEHETSLPKIVLKENWVRDRIRNWSGLFVTITQSRIYFIHQTVKEFLVSPTGASQSSSGWKHSLSTPENGSLMARICIGYLHLLSQRPFGSRDMAYRDKKYNWVNLSPAESKYTRNSFGRYIPKLSNKSAEKKYDGNTNEYGGLLQYSAEYWAYHLREAQVPRDVSLIAEMATLHDTESAFFPYWFEAAWSISLKPENALCAAAITGSEDVLGWILQQRSHDLNASRRDREESALNLACRFSNIESVRLLLDEGAIVDVESLLSAVLRKHTPLVMLLLDRGADVNAINESNESALYAAALHGYSEIVEMLLNHGADVSLDFTNERMPLATAMTRGHTEVVGLLLNHATDEIKSPDVVLQLLRVVIDDYNGKTWDVLQAKGVFLNIVLPNIAALLISACKRSGEKVVRFLIDRGANVNIASKNGNLPLHIVASRDRCSGVAAVLLQGGARIDAPNDHGDTALHVAAKSGQIEVVKILLEYGATLDSINTNYETSLMLAAKEMNDDVVDILLEKGAALDFVDINGDTTLHYASVADKFEWKGRFRREAVMRRKEEVQAMLRAGANINAVNKAGTMPLHVASKYGAAEVVKVLLENGASINSTDGDGNTALHLACSYGDQPAIELLVNAGAKIEAVNLKGQTSASLLPSRVSSNVAYLLTTLKPDDEFVVL